MTPAEAAALLAVAAAFDNRKPDADAAQAWSVALDGYRFSDCRDVIVSHYRKANDWLMPNHVITEVKRLREKRLHVAGDPTPPSNMTPLETIAWLRDARRSIADGEPVTVDYGELRERHLPDSRLLLPTPSAHPTPIEEEA
jgi:hypothetical protein